MNHQANFMSMNPNFYQIVRFRDNESSYILFVNLNNFRFNQKFYKIKLLVIFDFVKPLH